MAVEKKSTVLGDFKLRKKLGQGGMGTVYLGHQISLDRECAVKVLSKEMAEKPGFVERFIREARSMAKIDHPNVVKCFAVGEEKGYNFVAMELIDGKSMQDWADHLGKLSVPDAVLTAIVCAEALHHAHELSMIHRDVKPDNMLVTSKGIIKVSDMGLAKAIDDDDHGLTQSGTGLGTPHYMAPEQARNAKHVDRRCDIYALGGTLYYLLTGKTPFEGGSLLELIVNKEKGQHTSAKRLNSEIPEKLDLIIDKTMAPNPNHRYQDCQELINDLEALGLAGEALSFIDENIRVPARRAATSSRVTNVGVNQTIGLAKTVEAKGTPKPTTRKKSASSQGSSSSGTWFVKRVGSDGKTKVGKMSTPQIIEAMKADKLNLQTQVSLKAKGPFLPLAQVPVFEDEAKRMMTRQHAKAKDDNLAAQYEKLAKQYERRKWWDLLRKFRDGTMGLVGLLIWIAVIVAIGAAIYFIVPWLFDYIANSVGLDEPKSAPEALPAVPPSNGN